MPTLDELKPGSNATVSRVSQGGAVNRRIVDMGVTKGARIEVVRVAPLGDPVEIRLKGYSLTLRKEEAAAIEVNVE